MKFFSTIILAFLASATAFMPSTTPSTTRQLTTMNLGTPFKTEDGSRPEVEDLSGMSTFEKAQYRFSKIAPLPFAAGFGPTAKAERWNGRHAMAGWVCLLATGYAQSHGLFPEGGLDYKQWGTWVIVNSDGAGGFNTISAERAYIFLAHIHLLAVGVFATFSQFSGAGGVALPTYDTLLLQNGEKDEPAAGLIPPLRAGLNKDAEMLNGRLAMLGLIVVVMTSLINGTDVLTTIDQGLGGLLLK